MAFAIPTVKKRPRFGLDLNAQGSGPLNDSWFPFGASSVPGTAGPTDPANVPGPGMPSLADILGGDPLYQGFLADLRASGISDRAGLREARQRAITNFGEVPDFKSMVGGGAVGDLEADITPEIRSLAAQSTSSGLSTVARLKEAQKTAARQLTGFLVSRGLLRSGETGHQQARQQTEYTRSQFDARQQLLDYLAGYQSSFTQSEQQRRQSEQQAQMSALQNWLALNPGASGSGNTGSGSSSGGGIPAGWGWSPSPGGGFQLKDDKGSVRAIADQSTMGGYTVGPDGRLYFNGRPT